MKKNELPSLQELKFEKKFLEAKLKENRSVLNPTEQELQRAMYVRERDPHKVEGTDHLALTLKETIHLRKEIDFTESELKLVESQILQHHRNVIALKMAEEAKDVIDSPVGLLDMEAPEMPC